jgi:integrase
MADLVVWLRETGMRLGEALAAECSDVHPDGRQITLRRGVKRNRHGAKTRTIDLGRAAELLPRLEQTGRLFRPAAARQRRRQHPVRAMVPAAPAPRGARREGGGPDARPAAALSPSRRAHAFAIASLIDDPTCLYRLMEHLGHSSVKVTELYVRFLRGEGAQRRYSRNTTLFGSLPPQQVAIRNAG